MVLLKQFNVVAADGEEKNSGTGALTSSGQDIFKTATQKQVFSNS